MTSNSKISYLLSIPNAKLSLEQLEIKRNLQRKYREKYQSNMTDEQKQIKLEKYREYKKFWVSKKINTET